MSSRNASQGNKKSEKDGERCWNAEQTQTTNLGRELLFRCLKHSAPVGNLYSGGLGSYYLLFQYSQYTRQQEGSSRSIYRSKRYLQQACDAAQQALRNLPYKHKRDPNNNNTFMGEWMSAHCLLAVCQHHLGQKRQAKELLHKVLQRIRISSHSSSSQSNNNVKSGRAGELQVIWWLRQEFQEPTMAAALVVELAKQLFQEGGDGQFLSWNIPKKKNYLGSARGFVGIVYTLLGLSPKEWESIETVYPNALEKIRQTLDHLLQDPTCIHPSGNLRPFPNSTVDGVDWWQGGAGLALLLIRASQVFQHAEYLQNAHALCKSVLWPRGLEDVSKGVGLGFGCSGLAFCFLHLSAHLPSSDLWQRRATYLVQWGIGQWEAYLDTEKELPTGWNFYSIYQGLGGLSSVVFNLHSTKIEMPLYCVGYEYTVQTTLDIADDEEEYVVEPTKVEEELTRMEAQQEEGGGTPDARTPAKPQHFSVPTKESLFWSLQTDTNIGDSSSYKPATMSTSPSQENAQDTAVTDTPGALEEAPNRSSSTTTTSPTRENQAAEPPTETAILPKKEQTAKSSPKSAAKSPPRPSPTRSTSTPLSSQRSSPSKFGAKSPLRPSPFRSTPTSLSSQVTKQRTTRSSPYSRGSTTPTPTRSLDKMSKPKLSHSVKKKLGHESSLKQLHRHNAPLLRQSTATLPGSGPTVRLTRAAQLRLKISSPEKKDDELAQRRKAANEARLKAEQKSRSLIKSLSLARSKVAEQKAAPRVPNIATTPPSVKVRLTRASQLKLSASTEKRSKTTEDDILYLREKSQDARRLAEEEARRRFEKQEHQKNKRIARMKAEKEERQRAERTAKLKRADEARLKKEREERMKAERVARQKAQRQARLQVEKEAREKMAAIKKQLLKKEKEASQRSPKASTPDAKTSPKILPGTGAKVRLTRAVQLKLKSSPEKQVMAKTEYDTTYLKERAEEARRLAEEKEKLRIEKQERLKAERLAKIEERMKSKKDERQKKERQIKSKCAEEVRLKRVKDVQLKPEELPRSNEKKRPRLKPTGAAHTKADEQARLETEEQVQSKAEEDVRPRAEEKARSIEEAGALRKAEEETLLKAEDGAPLKSEKEARLKADEEARLKAEKEARLKAEEEARLKAEEDTKIKAEEEACRKAEEDARLKAEEEARMKAEEEARLKAEEDEARRKAEEDARLNAEQEARLKAEAETRIKVEEEARRKAEEEARLKAEEEARLKVEEEARLKVEEEAKLKAEDEARRKAEEDARLKAEEEARVKAEEEARLKAEEEARLKAEAETSIKAEEEARRTAEEEARLKAEEEARMKAEEEARLKAEDEARRKAEEDARLNAEQEARSKTEAETKIKVEEEARRKAEEEARLKAEEAARLKAEEEARSKAEAETRIKVEEEACRKAEEEARIKAEKEAKMNAEEEARLKAEEEARIKAEEEARRKAEEEARLKVEEEAQLKVEEEARLKAEEEARRKAEEEARLKAEEEARLKAEEEARIKAEEEACRKVEEEARLKVEEEAISKAKEEARLKAEEEASLKAEEEAKLKSEEEAGASLSKVKSDDSGDFVPASLKGFLEDAENKLQLDLHDVMNFADAEPNIYSKQSQDSDLFDQDESSHLEAGAKRNAGEEVDRLWREEEEDRLKAEEEARREADGDARLKAQEESRIKVEEEARLKAEEEARVKAEEESRVKAEEEAKLKAQQNLKPTLESKFLVEEGAGLAEAKSGDSLDFVPSSLRGFLEEAENRMQLDLEGIISFDDKDATQTTHGEHAEARLGSDEKAYPNLHEEEGVCRNDHHKVSTLEEQARTKEEEHDRLEAAEQTRLKAEEEARIKAEEEAWLEALEEARLKAEEDARLKAENEGRLKAEEKACMKAEEEAWLKALEEAKLQAREDARLKAEEEARLKAEEEARIKAEEEAWLKALEEAKLNAGDNTRLQTEKEHLIQSVSQTEENVSPRDGENLEVEDDEDYVPESLRGYFAEAEHKMKFHLDDVMNFENDRENEEIGLEAKEATCLLGAAIEEKGGPTTEEARPATNSASGDKTEKALSQKDDEASKSHPKESEKVKGKSEAFSGCSSEQGEIIIVPPIPQDPETLTNEADVEHVPSYSVFDFLSLGHSLSIEPTEENNQTNAATNEEADGITDGKEGGSSRATTDSENQKGSIEATSRAMTWQEMIDTNT